MPYRCAGCKGCCGGRGAKPAAPGASIFLLFMFSSCLLMELLPYSRVKYFDVGISKFLVHASHARYLVDLALVVATVLAVARYAYFFLQLNLS